ncbi:hypothetical protein LguiB_014062 [Lonicera macranthoides]
MKNSGGRFTDLLTEPTDHFGKTESRFTDYIGSVAVPRRLVPTMSVRFINRPNRFGNRTVTSPKATPKSTQEIQRLKLLNFLVHLVEDLMPILETLPKAWYNAMGE